MKCPRCQDENPPGAKFCLECAAPLGLRCASCGTQLPAGAKFCFECATPVAVAGVTPRFVSPATYTPRYLADRILSSKAALEGERKQVTVLFADVKSSMELLADRDPEDARRVLDPILERMIDAVHHYEGTVNQVMGDGIMALFGAPLAHEDHAVRACHAALRMREAVRRYAADMYRATGVPIQIRLGLNSGEVVVRSIANDLHMDYTAVGQTTHLAGRMEQMAQPDTIMATAACVRLAEGYVTVAPRGSWTIRGLAAPVDVYEITGVGTVRSRLEAAVGRGLSPLVGREAELDRLRRALALTAEGRGHVVAVVGEPGAGKSRLIYEVARARPDDRWLFLETAGLPLGRGTAYLPIVELLTRYFQLEPDDDPRRRYDTVRDRLRALDESLPIALPALSALLGLPPADPGWAALAASQRRRLTHEAITRLVLRESVAQPVCLVVEDLHWIDSETQAVLDALVDSLLPARLLLLVSYRPGYAHRWGDKTCYTQLTLDRLPPPDAQQLLEALVGADPTLDELKALLISTTGGNPFFLEESVRALVDDGVLVGAAGRYRLARPVQALHVPPTVQAVIAARIDRLGPDDKALLEAAAVIGKDVPFALLQAAVAEPEAVVRERLERLQAAGFLYEARPAPDLRYTFRHAVTQEVTYGALLHERRRTLHARIVAALEEPGGDDDTHVETLAHHARSAELWDRAARYLQAAGDKAFAQSANREAVLRFEQALEALSRLPETPTTRETAIDLHLGLRNGLTLLGQHERTLGHLRQARSMAERIGDRRRLARILSFEVNSLFLLGRHGEAVEAGETARLVAEELGDRTRGIVVEMYVGRAHLYLGDFPRAIEIFERVVGTLTGPLTYDRLGLPILPAVFARAHLVEALAEVGRFAEAAAYGEQALELAEATKHPDTLLWAYRALGLLHLARGDSARATERLQYAYGLCQDYDMPVYAPRIAAELALARSLGGHAVEGVPTVQRALDEAAARRQVASYSIMLLYLGEICLLAGQLEGAERAAARALELLRAQHERGHEAAARRVLAAIRAEQPGGDLASAETDYRLAHGLAAELGMRPLVARCQLGLGQLAASAGRRTAAAEALGSARTHFLSLGMEADLARAEAELKAISEPGR